MINFIIEAVIVTASSWLLTRKYFGIRLLSDAILVSFILLFAQIVLVELLLGVAGQLYFLNVLLAHAAILLIIYLIYFRKEAPPLEKLNVEPFINSNLLLLAASIFFSFFLVKLFSNLINPPLSPDSLQVHLAFPATWITNGNLDNPINIFGSLPILKPGTLETCSSSYYPINAQLFFTWLMLPLRNAFLADAGEAPFYIIGIVAVYAILRKYDVNRVMALLSGFLWVLIPSIFKQLRTGSLIDVICAVLFLLVFNALLLLKLDFSLKNAALFGIATGLFVGTKIINLAWLLALVPLACYILYRKVKESKFELSKVLSILAVIVSMIILFGCFVYLKNYFILGNPLFPVELRIFGKTIFKGLLDNAAYKSQVAGWKLDFMKMIFKEGLGLQFIALILPCTFIPVIFYKYLKAKVLSLGGYLLLFATPFFMLILYSFFINIYTSRYFFPYLSFGLLTAVIFITKLPRGDKYLAAISFISILSAAFELANRYELVSSILLSLAVFILLFLYKKQVSIFYRSKNFSRIMLAVLLAGFLFLTYLNNRYDKEEFSRYPLSFPKREAWQSDIGRGWKALNELTKGGSRIAYTGRMEFYPLFGSGLKNTVKYVSINAKEVTAYNKPDGLFRKTRDFTAWRENLKKGRIEYLFIALPFFDNRESEDPKKFPIEDEWAGAHPDDFELIFSNSLSRIYKVLIK
ncbi:MAG: hypothetical protein WC731_00890 [Candidatus Omnitrophota bacterium]|jgi:hypothetical protein